MHTLTHRDRKYELPYTYFFLPHSREYVFIPLRKSAVAEYFLPTGKNQLTFFLSMHALFSWGGILFPFSSIVRTPIHTFMHESNFSGTTSSEVERSSLSVKENCTNFPPSTNVDDDVGSFLSPASLFRSQPQFPSRPTFRPTQRH